MKVYVSPDLYDNAVKLIQPGDEVIVCDDFVEGTWKVEGVPQQGWDEWMKHIHG